MKRQGCRSLWFIYPREWPLDDTLEPPSTLQTRQAAEFHFSNIDLQTLAGIDRKYQYPAGWFDGVGSGHINPFDKKKSNAGFVLNGGNDALGPVIAASLERRTRCQTHNASLANVFIVPFLWGRGLTHERVTKCSIVSKATEGFHQLASLLKRGHLAAHNVHRHTIFVSHSPECDGWWQRPITELLLARRFSATPQRAAREFGAEGLPYPSVIRTAAGHPLPHERQDPEDASAREYLIAYHAQVRIFSPRAWGGGKPVTKLRATLRRECRQPASHCATLNNTGRSYWALYSMAHFCLQPIGDTCERKGIIDALLMGCIPVLFHECQLHLWELHWGGWRGDSSVFINADSLIKGSTTVAATLRAISLQRRKEMRDTIRRFGHQLTYSLVDDDKQGDALAITLNAVANSEPGKPLVDPSRAYGGW
eukprot:CAMPEP_0119304550 /NCGR_PEP_ID=MMETSP1333-20130426/5747_1 /TAXON_ID=418940 /ORGANISM="Scyphosphaera apsteinii, Strain RCC1455" /LENGTH=422 /DNA_ID=CAMNT_0007307455 /DNA_START=161 /DNA_END=1426 /DNA_ORIENTATION=-